MRIVLFDIFSISNQLESFMIGERIKKAGNFPARDGPGSIMTSPRIDTIVLVQFIYTMFFN